MGAKADEPLTIERHDLSTYLRTNHSVFMDVLGKTYYLTDVNSHYWRVQRTDILNEKNHFIDCSELVPTVDEFLDLPFDEQEKSVRDLFDEATFFASIK
ncbi:MAG: CDP-alcohol phosphatidyltransferase [Coriobacteriales bacterium]|nr:CDP-alcohol phosphatidyltransferase [Coriobacteriales bacterium]